MSTKPILRVVSSAEASNDTDARPDKKIRNHKAAALASSAGNFALKTLMVALVGLKAAVFYPLMWMHGFVATICNGLAMLGIFALVLGALFGVGAAILWKIALASFICFLAQWIYTGIVLGLAPGSMALEGRFNDHSSRE